MYCKLAFPYYQGAYMCVFYFKRACPSFVALKVYFNSLSLCKDISHVYTIHGVFHSLKGPSAWLFLHSSVRPHGGMNLGRFVVITVAQTVMSIEPLGHI